MSDFANIQSIQDFPSLIKYLRKDLGWPVDEEQVDNLTFEYTPQELGLEAQAAVKIREIKQLRPLTGNQPWGIFWIDFEPKRLPVVVMRRILGALVRKQRGGRTNQATWKLDDLMFISATGEPQADAREIVFAHFHQEQGDLPTMRVLGWDGADTKLKLDFVAATLKDHMRWPDDPRDVDRWREEWASVFRHRIGYVIKTANALAERLAELARGIRDAAQTLMAHETEKGRLRSLHKAFQTALIHDLSEEDFADTYAQTITYGLLTAAISRTDMSAGQYGTALVAENVSDMVPITNPFLREMLQTFLQAGGRKGGIDFDELGIQDVVELLRGEETDLPAVLRDFGNRTQGEDPVINFYQGFLSAYNNKLRIQRGVFFTPKPAVSYIVRSVHELLQKEFGLQDGLASTVTWGEMVKSNPEIKIPKGTLPDSPFVTILDPAVGTATFLVEVIDVVHKTMTAKWEKQGLNKAAQQVAWNEYVPKHLLPRLYGYELMIAPYAIAHMKIGLKLHETGYHFRSDERVRVYLTNSLEEPSPLAQESAASLFEALGHEAQAVNDVKRRANFTVVIGNPPYAGHSANASTNPDGTLNFIGRLLRDYYFVDGQPLGERNIKWLQDDYVKFLRWSQWRINETGEGILAMITNHGYLDNPTFRGMRQQLMQTFDDIYILDLHGNNKKKEMAPDGSKDENVFDIQQGVAICLMVKHRGKKEKPLFFRADLFGNRERKYDELLTGKIKWNELKPQPPFYFFLSQNLNLQTEYEKGWKIVDAMPKYANGLFTARDSLTIHWTPEEVESTVKDFISLSAENARRKYNLGTDVRDWKVELAQNDIKSNKLDLRRITHILYRPFDIRYTYYTGQSRGFHCMPRPEIMRNMLADDNIALNIGRAGQNIDLEGAWDLVFCTESITDLNLYRRGGNILIPLFVIPDKKKATKQVAMFDDEVELIPNGKKVNFSNAFIEELEKRLGLKYSSAGNVGLKSGFGSEDIFNYVYAILWSEIYRQRFSEFLKRDYPYLPITSDCELFNELSIKGKELILLHLLRHPIVNTPVIELKGCAENIVAPGYPKFVNGQILINPQQAFASVHEDVWNFHIGGYQICHKWLKDRRGKQLTIDEISKYQKIVVSLKQTIRLISEIDDIIENRGGWPIQ